MPLRQSAVLRHFQIEHTLLKSKPFLSGLEWAYAHFLFVSVRYMDFAQLLETTVSGLGYELVGVGASRRRGGLLRDIRRQAGRRERR